jgi:hypothetical protein
MKPLATIIPAVIFLSVIACSSNEIGFSKDVNPETIFMDYHVNYAEGEDSADCLLQYRFAGENGTTLVLSEPSTVKIDGIELRADSSDFAGAYYEKKFAAAAFEGNHVIAFTDMHGKIRTEVFNFHRIRLANDILSANKQRDLVLNFEYLQQEDMIEVNISDTSGATEDIKIAAKPVNGKLAVTAAQLQTLSIGPCKLEIYKSISKPLQQQTAEGGKISIIHVIKQTSVELKDYVEEAVTKL